MAALKVLQINLRSDYGGGPHHMWQLISHLSPNIETFAAMPKEEPYWDLNVSNIGAERCFELPHRKFLLSRLFALAKFIKTENISLIHAHGKGASMYGRLLSLLNGIPCIYTFHGLHFEKYGLLKKTLYFLIENLLAILTNTFIAVSEGEKKQASKIFPFAKKKIVLVQNGVNIPETISQKKHDNNSIIICCIARLDYQKNLELLIPITKKLLISTKKKVTINVIGVGNNDNELKNLIDKEKLTDTINLRGFTKDTSFWLNDAHLFLSTSRWEGMPLSILEASAHGLPVVASDVIGNKDAVTNEVTGYLYPVEQPEKAAAFVLEILNDKNLYEQMSKKGKENVQKNFSLKVMAQKTEHLYLSLAK